MIYECRSDVGILRVVLCQEVGCEYLVQRHGEALQLNLFNHPTLQHVREYFLF